MTRKCLYPPITPFGHLLLVASVLLVAAAQVLADANIVVERFSNDNATPEFRFKTIAPPSVVDAATDATFILSEGRQDPNGGDLRRLHDGQLPFEPDEPEANFFFMAGTKGGKITVDLGKAIAIKEINTYSWHPGSRGPQVYRVYADQGQGRGSEPPQASQPDAEQSGWTLLASVDTRGGERPRGGQVGVSISNSKAPLGRHRFLLFDISCTETNDPFGNSFFSEIDIVDADAPAPPKAEVSKKGSERTTVAAEDGKYQITIDTTDAPDLGEWSRTRMAGVVQEWYPKLVKMLASEDFEAPTRISIRFRPDMRGTPAATSGGRISCNARWFRENLQGEALGCVVHEMVHIVQSYPGRGGNKPGWLTEGIADYLRWYKFEPESRGAEISRRNLARAKYDASYRVTANFLDWASRTFNADLVPLLNRALREGAYTEALWKQLTGFEPLELDEKWRAALESTAGKESQVR